MQKHGGDIYSNNVELDFSVNTSPYGMPVSVREALSSAVLKASVYPDAEYRSLREAIANFEGNGVNPEDIICGNGASEIIYAISRAVCPSDASLFIPCFSEYEDSIYCANKSAIINFVSLDEKKDFLPDEALVSKLYENNPSLIILGHPNNPTGRLIPREYLSLIKEKSSSGVITVLDESFLPLCEDAYDEDGKLLPYEISANMVVIKSFTKSMSIPGVRIGYAICKDEALRNKIRAQIPEWNVSVIANDAALVCCLEGESLGRKILDKENGLKALRKELENLLSQNFKVYPSDTNFMLIKKEPEDGCLYEKLLQEKVLIRKCDNYRGLNKDYYRIAVKDKKSIAKLSLVLTSESTGHKDARNFSEEFEHVMPEDIEKNSFAILSSELEKREIFLEGDKETVIKRCIHTTADFDYASTLMFSENAVKIAKELIKGGAIIVTDTNMGLSGINKKELAKYGGEALCFMADYEIAKKAKQAGTTRAHMSMKHAASLGKKTIYAIGNAPTALITLCEMIDSKEYIPDFVIGVPVGFVNVEAAKEMIMKRGIPYIVNRGRKGGSNVAAAICNALLYQLRDEDGQS